MARLRRQQDRTGVTSIKYKTGASGGGFGANPKSQPSGAALTITANDEVGLAGADDPIDYFLDIVDVDSGKARVFTKDAGEIQGILTNGTVTPGSALKGYSDTDRGKAVAAANTDAQGKWVVIRSSAGKADVQPSA